VSLSEIPEGSRVIIDPSIFLFAITAASSGVAEARSAQCYWFLDRCRVRTVLGIISTVTLVRLWKQLEAIAALKTGDLQDAAKHQALVCGVPTDAPQLNFAARVVELAATSLSIVTVQREDFSRAADLTRGLFFDIDSALTVAAVEREYRDSFHVATATSNFDTIHASRRCEFELFRPTDI
jgi:hypothetical protein